MRRKHTHPQPPPATYIRSPTAAVRGVLLSYFPQNDKCCSTKRPHCFEKLNNWLNSTCLADGRPDVASWAVKLSEPQRRGPHLHLHRCLRQPDTVDTAVQWGQGGESGGGGKVKNSFFLWGDWSSLNLHENVARFKAPGLLDR